MIVRAYSSGDEKEVIRLWRDCGLVMPQNDPAKDIRRKTDFQPDLFLVGTVDGRVVATVMAGYDGHRGWLNYLAVAPAHRGSGLGRRLVGEAEVRLGRLGCPKINIQVRRTNTGVMAFYEKIGFFPDPVESMGKRLEQDREKPDPIS